MISRLPADAPYNEPELIRGLADGDQSAFETIYNKYFNSVFYFAKRFVTDAPTAEDITSETFIKLWNRRGDFENLNKLQSFLYTATRNACINILRSEKRQSEREKQLLYLLSQEDEPSIADQQLTASIYQYIYEQIEKLPPQEKKIFKLSYIEGLSNEEISDQLGINNQSVRNYKSRALKTLRLSIIDKDIYQMWILILMTSKFVN